MKLPWAVMAYSTKYGTDSIWSHHHTKELAEKEVVALARRHRDYPKDNTIIHIRVVKR